VRRRSPRLWGGSVRCEVDCSWGIMERDGKCVIKEEGQTVCDAEDSIRA
jgi:hypothetical protein